MRARIATVVVVGAMSLLVSSGVIGAPYSLEGAAQVGKLAPAVRLNPPAPVAPPASPTDQVVTSVNAERTSRGLPALQLDARLQAAAQAHSDDQAWMGQMSHTGSDGSTPGQRVTRAGFVWRSVAENVAYGYGSAQAVVAAWMASAGHRANILSSNTHVGVGLAYRNGVPYWTLLFATPR